jgi:hypothetical protein
VTRRGPSSDSPKRESDNARPALTRQRPDVRIGILAGGAEYKAGIDARELNVIEDIERLHHQRQEAAKRLSLPSSALLRDRR